MAFGALPGEILSLLTPSGIDLVAKKFPKMEYDVADTVTPMTPRPARVTRFILRDVPVPGKWEARGTGSPDMLLDSEAVL